MLQFFYEINTMTKNENSYNFIQLYCNGQILNIFQYPATIVQAFAKTIT